MPHPILMLDPKFAGQLLGIGFEYQDDLGRFGGPDGKHESPVPSTGPRAQYRWL
jgi:hypothetical protein